MGFCEKCGKNIEEGKVFCDDCLSSTRTRSLSEKETDIVADHEVFSFKGKRSSKLYRLTRVLPLIFGGIVVIFGIIVIFSDSLNLEIPSGVLPIISVIIGIIVIILIFQRTKQDFFLPIGLIILIFTLGGILLIPESFEYYNLIFPSGCALVGLFLVFYMIRNSKRHYILYFELAIVILALAGAVVLPDFASIIIAISLVLIGILTLIRGF